VLTTIPKSWFSWDLTVLEDSKPVAELRLSTWRERGTLTVQGKDYKVYREGVMTGAFILESDTKVLARAIKPSVFRRSFELEYAGKQYTLRSQGWSRYSLFHGDERLGSISRGFFSRKRATVDLPEDLPLVLRLFLTWLVMILWKRDANSS
jgi:hypothetical protein